VKVDVVVRDKKDAILRGLTAADLEVYEDGVRAARPVGRPLASPG